MGFSRAKRPRTRDWGGVITVLEQKLAQFQFIIDVDVFTGAYGRLFTITDVADHSPSLRNDLVRKRVRFRIHSPVYSDATGVQDFVLRLYYT